MLQPQGGTVSLIFPHVMLLLPRYFISVGYCKECAYVSVYFSHHVIVTFIYLFVCLTIYLNNFNQMSGHIVCNHSGMITVIVKSNATNLQCNE